MAADDAAVVVTLRANLKDYEAALKSAVRSTERAAAAAEKAISGVGKGGVGTLFVDGQQVGEARLSRTVPFIFSIADATDIGIDHGAPVTSSDRWQITYGGSMKELALRRRWMAFGATSLALFMITMTAPSAQDDPLVKTIGISLVAAFAARAGALPPAASIAATRRPAKSTGF